MNVQIRAGKPVRARVNGILAAALVVSVNKKLAEVVLKVGTKNHTVPYDLSKFRSLTMVEYKELAAKQDYTRIENGQESTVVKSQRIFMEEMRNFKGNPKADGFRQKVIARYTGELELTSEGAETYFYNANLALVRQENVD